VKVACPVATFPSDRLVEEPPAATSKLLVVVVLPMATLICTQSTPVGMLVSIAVTGAVSPSAASSAGGGTQPASPSPRTIRTLDTIFMLTPCDDAP
jgi:hypothetical protein